jgi:DNA-binding response OmpR family regulator
MVIEDDPDILDILEYVLRSDGHEVISSPDGAILADVEEKKPGIIFMDEWLENEKGSELCLLLKENPVTASIPVIIISALSSIENVVKTARADGFIKKPFDIDELNPIINRFIQH